MSTSAPPESPAPPDEHNEAVGGRAATVAKSRAAVARVVTALATGRAAATTAAGAVGERLGLGAGDLRALPPSERERLFRRRRRAAVAAAIGLVALLALLLSGGGSSKPPATAQLARRPVIPPPTLVAAQAAHDNRIIARVLAYTPYVRAGTPNKPEVALTFDDGPGPFTPAVLAVLERYHAPATFFVVGQSLIYFSASLPVEVQDGFVIGDHTQNHKLLSRLAPRDQAAQIAAQTQAIGSYGAPFPHLFRPPYGGFDASTLALLRRDGMLMVMWSVDTHDYLQPGVGMIVQRTLAGARPGAIILMHDAGGQRAETVQALPIIIAALRRRGLHLVTVPRLLADDPPPVNQPPPTPLTGGAG